VLDSPFPQLLSRSYLVYLLVWNPLLHTFHPIVIFFSQYMPIPSCTYVTHTTNFQHSSFPLKHYIVCVQPLIHLHIYTWLWNYTDWTYRIETKQLNNQLISSKYETDSILSSPPDKTVLWMQANREVPDFCSFHVQHVSCRADSDQWSHSWPVSSSQDPGNIDTNLTPLTSHSLQSTHCDCVIHTVLWQKDP